MSTSSSPDIYLETFGLSTFGTGSGDAARYLYGQAKLRYTSLPGQIPDNIGWETSKTFDVGLDAGFLNGRLNLTADYYVRKTVDMYTVGPTLPDTFGATAPKGNYADMRTNGWELSLTWRDQFNLAGKPFSYSVKGMVWDYYSTITKFNNDTRSLSTYYEGQRVGEIWGYHIEGLYEHEDQVAARTTGTKVGNYDYSQPRGPKSDGTYAPNGKVNQSSVAKVSQKSNKYLPGDLM